MTKRTLLLADDSVTIQKVVNLTFADEGIDVVTVGDGDSAMQKISEISPDVVLADVHMPGLSGYQICEIVRDNPSTRNLPIVLLVGSFEPFDESEAARVGANAYLTKPFQSIRQLVTQVTDLMQSAPAEASQPEPAQPEQPGQSEMEAVEQPPSVRVPDTRDIDSLYHQSFSGPGQMQSQMPAAQPEVQTQPEETHNAFGDQTYEEAQPEMAVGTPPYVDAGMDDEMIETNHVGGVEQPTHASIFDQGQPQVEEQHSYEVAPQSEYTTEPQYSIDASASTSYDEVSETGWEAGGQEAASSSAFDSYAEDRTEQTAHEESPAPPAPEFDEFSLTEQIPASITASSLNLDDLEILDLPPLENVNTQEFTTNTRSAAEGGGKEIVSLSPELMDQLVQRVVEKLSKDK